MNSVKEAGVGWRDTLSGLMPADGRGKWVAIVLGLYLLIAILLGMYWSIMPGPGDVRAEAQALAAETGGTVVTGSVTTAALISVVETLLHKPGGYIRNDRFPPGVWLDNMSNWEFG
ncbi:MAG: DUF2333 family protein, partial [Halioglobus sp.]|nr:DUF2333 family protein [Halioglobus sp.]